MRTSNLSVFVINLQRRPDRLQYMTSQLKDIDVEWERVDAHDIYSVDQAALAREVSVDNHILRMSPGSQCCALTNFDIYRRIVTEGLHAALILQDDVELSHQIKPFLTSLTWLPDDIHLVQFEKYGKLNSSRLMGPALGNMPIEGRTMHRLYSRTAGAACYLITNEGATRILAKKPVLRMPIDHFLFSPNLSPMFDQLGVAVVSPALARQRQSDFRSDIQEERQYRRKTLPMRMRRLWQELNRVPSQLTAMMRVARWQSFGYKK